jgi:excisionase family DNA binding protein
MNANDGTTVRLLLTVEQAAQRLGIGRTLMYALVKDGNVESVQIGRLRRIPADALARYVDQLRTVLPQPGRSSEDHGHMTR